MRRPLLWTVLMIAAVIGMMLMPPAASKGVEGVKKEQEAISSAADAPVPTVEQAHAAEAKPEHAEPVIVREPLNIDALARAVAMQETGNCKSPNAITAIANNNCYSIKENGGFKYFDTQGDSTAYFKGMWKHGKNYHNQFPDLAMATLYSSPGAAEEWLRNVTKLYDRYNAQ